MRWIVAAPPVLPNQDGPERFRRSYLFRLRPGSARGMLGREAPMLEMEWIKRIGKKPMATGQPSNQGTGAGQRPFDGSRLSHRLILLLLGLVGLKSVIWFSSSQYLFESHWRVSGAPITSLNYAGFIGFALLTGALIWKLSGACAEVTVRRQRILNAAILLSGLWFILAGFHEGENSHLRAVCSGTLALSDLGSYYALNFFFRPPYLAVWLAVYAVGYWLLARQRRERLALRLTAVFSTAYILLCLQYLLQFGVELVVLDVIGVFCLGNMWRARPVRWPLLLLPLGLMLTGYLCWHTYTESLRAPSMEFLILLAATLIGVAGAFWLGRKLRAPAAWSWWLLFGFVASVLLLNAFYLQAANYRQLLVFALTLPRYFLGEMALVALLLVCGRLYLRRRPAGSLLWLDVVALGVLLLSLLDLRLVQIMGTRLDWDVAALGVGEGPGMMWRLSRPYLGAVLMGVFGLSVGYALLLGGAKKLSRAHGNGMRRTGSSGWGFAGLLIPLALAGRLCVGQDKVVGGTLEVFARTLPVKTWLGLEVLSAEQFQARAKSLQMTLPGTEHNLMPPEDARRDLNVIFVLLESTYNKHLSLFNGSEETQPLLSRYRGRMELFPNFYSSYAGSINARFACYSGLYPVGDHKQFTSRRIPVKTLFEILHEHGWENSVFYSSHFDYTGFRDFLSARQVTGMYDADTMPGPRQSEPVSWGLREEETLAAMRAFLRQHAQSSQRFFMSYIPAAPHYPYDGTPERFKKFPDVEYKDFTPRYLNDLLYMDWVVASLLDELKATGLLDRTLVVITGDHGEMLGENGGPIGHGWRLTPELANVPLIIMDPTRPERAINYTVGSQVDLLPTILDKLGVPLPHNQLYQGVSLYSPAAARARTIYLNSFSQYAVLEGRRMHFGERGKSHFRSYSIQNSGAESQYPELRDPEASVPDFGQFDAFQAGLLKHYDYYRSLLQPRSETRLAAGVPRP